MLAIPNRNPSSQRLIIFTAVLILAAVIADYVRFLPHSRMLWQTLTHDRNGHYDSSLKLALALRHGEFLGFIRLLGNYNFWLPLNDLTSAVALTAWGPDYRVGMAPSLIGFWLTAFFAFLLVRRVLVWGGDAAGVIVAMLILASPAFRSYAVEIMFESLGAGLTMMTLYCYVVARQQGSARYWRDLSLGLTALFLHKSNYYLIAVVGIIVSDLCADPRGYRKFAENVLRHRDWGSSIIRWIRDPLSFPFVLAAAITIAIFVRGPHPFQFRHYSMSVYPPKRPLTIAFALLVLRIVAREPLQWWRFRDLPPAPRQLVLWHVIPLAVWFLIPQTLAGFLAYVGPWNSPDQAISSRDLSQAVSYYAHAFHTFYNVDPFLGFCTIGLFLIGWPLARTWRTASLSVLILPLLGLAMVIAHPFVENRFIHSFIAIMWVAAACAAVSLLDRITSSFGSAPRATCAMLLVFIAGLPLAQHLFSPAFVPSAGVTGAGSLLDLSDSYLPDLAGFNRVAMFSTVPQREFPEWTYLERYPGGAFEWPLEGWLSASQVTAKFATWIAATDADAVVFYDIAPDSKNYAVVGDYQTYAAIQQMIPTLSDFRLHKRWNFPDRRCSITMWTRQPSAARPTSPNR